MQCVSRLLRATPLSSTRSFFSTPPCSVYPTKPAARSFSVTSPHCKFVVPKRKQQVNMPSGDMTTFKGKPFDRASLESVMKVLFPLISCCAAPCYPPSHIDPPSDDSSTRPPSTSTVVSLACTTMARPAPPSPTTLSTSGASTLSCARTCWRVTRTRPPAADHTDRLQLTPPC